MLGVEIAEKGAISGDFVVSSDEAFAEDFANWVMKAFVTTLRGTQHCMWPIYFA